ncbi:hypothetical protein SPRG_13422 [Saprolegnia parasitica CBS 223.65]|uniref:WW domain-containing protein n=1 Tax=Saprolegnia parasitica (strain CBS 223.65) TaxID=695850 RepID=A0A067BV43_SAPPC|nr:hypothetical protein SPRG_13422 [Saprolegnia parasitica CBS 223.65]KDO20670.1 hypothetical protein SPRG_13422 [Saprolegnia parasitica CBS 223.65]|eukprot:XP_012208635.1 hypothetical protein SPRG_13422 [Saprolegnia parasitica CBS 223.65]
MPFFRFRRKKPVEAPMEPTLEVQELIAIEAETSTLLQAVATPSPTKKRPRKVVGRVTIEVLDSVPPTPSSDEPADIPVADAAPAIAPALPPMNDDALQFTDEEARVRRRLDTFVPAFVPAKDAVENQLAQLQHEKDRLQKRMSPVHPRAPEMEFDILLPPSEKDATDAAATQIQAVARGFVARRATRRTCALQEAAKWRQVHDPERGETWYYNSATGQSQWAPPTAALSPPRPTSPQQRPSSGHRTTLPPLSPRQSNLSIATHPVSPLVSSPVLPSLGREPFVLQDVDPNGDCASDASFADATADWMDNDALFLADGSKNAKLRDTIRGALKVSRFDSVSALLTHNVTFNAPKPKARGHREIALGRKPEQFMVAVVAKKPSAKSKKAPARLPTPVRIRDVADPGFLEASQSNNNNETIASDDAPKPTQCFACWSAIKGCKCEAHTVGPARIKHASESALLCSNWEVDQLRRKYRAEEIQEVFLKANSSLRYDKVRKSYVTVIECRHPIYRAIDAATTTLNKTMRRKLHVRAWFRSFLEHLRLGRVKKAGDAPSILKVRETLRNAKWCTDYASSVRSFQPMPPVTKQRFTDAPIDGVIVVPPNTPALKHWVLKTEVPRPIVLYQPRKYELLPRRCIPMPTPSFLDQIPLPVSNTYIDGLSKVSWLERVSARISLAAMYRGIMQVKACTPPRGFDLPRRTRITPPTTVLFASFGRKPTPGNLAVGGLVAEMLIYMVVTTFVPPQFGNFNVTDRRAICPPLTLDHSAIRRPPTILLVIQGEGHAMCINRPEQTGEDACYGFITMLERPGLKMPDETKPAAFLPHETVLTFNVPTANATVTTRADRYYPFCEPTTRESTIIAFMHLLWLGKSSRNQTQCFTTLGSQDPGDFMKNCNVDGAMGAYTPMVYRSWAYMQTSPFEEFVTDDGIAYWYEKATGRTYWTRPVLEIEKHRGPDGDIEGDVQDGVGEKATTGVGGADARYTQKEMRSYMTKTMESVEDRATRLKAVDRSAKTTSIIKPSFHEEAEALATRPSRPSPTKVAVPKLSFQIERPVVSHSKGPTPTTKPTPQLKSSSKPATSKRLVAPNTQKLIESLTSALGASMATSSMSPNDVLQLGIGLGMGLGLRDPEVLLEDDVASHEAISDRHDDEAAATDEEVPTARSLATTRTEMSVLPDATPDEIDVAVTKAPIPFGTTFLTHATPGEGESWVNKPLDFSAESQTAVDGFHGAVHRSVAKLPKNFVACANSTKTVKAETNYLPASINKNQPRCVGLVRPRTAADEWLVVGYDPWVAGKELFNLEFVKALAIEDEDAPAAPLVAAAFIDKESHAAQQEFVSQAAKEAMELEHVMSLARHGKYAEVENLLNQPDWSLSIDMKDNAGNTLLSIACQNNNKRIAKLCLRKGADLNTQNLNGQSLLHYCHAYGFHDLMEYLMEKGARDDLVNKDGLTCYEGLDADTVEKL